MKMRLKAWLLRRLLDLREDTDVAIVSVMGHEPVITHGTYYRKSITVAGPDIETYTSRWIH